MTYDFKLVCTLPAAPEAVYEAWLSSKGHSAMTGGAATATKRAGGAFTAWDGYIYGKNIELSSGKRIVQSWRTTQFGPDDPDSTVIVELAPAKSGTKLTLWHRGVPDGQTSYEKGGWKQHYFEPMKAYFSAQAKGTKASVSASTARKR